MAEMVGSAVVQESVSGVISYLSTNHEEKASRAHNVERLEMAHTELELALERSAKLPIMDASLLRQRKMYKRAYEECGDALRRCKQQRVLEDDNEGAATTFIEQGVTTRSSSIPRRIAHAVKSSISSFLGLGKDDLSRSEVRRFEWFADKAGKFMRDVETGCSLAHYRFFSPLTRHLLQGNTIDYEMVRGSQNLHLRVEPMFSEGRGVEARIRFSNKDRPSSSSLQGFTLRLILRLSESTDIIGITIKSLQSSLRRHFKSLAGVAMGELAQLPTQDVLSSVVTPPQFFLAPAFRASQAFLATTFRPDPVCCRENGPHANGIISSELLHEFPEQVVGVHFTSCIPASEYNLYLSSSSDEATSGSIMRDWPPLELAIAIAPHSSRQKETLGTYEILGGNVTHIHGNLHQMEEMVAWKAMDCFIHQPELTDYFMYCVRAHGSAHFHVRKYVRN